MLFTFHETVELKFELRRKSVLLIIKKISSRLVGYGSDQRAAISPMMVFLLIPLCGIMALAGEVSFWYMTQRALQNAADSAAVAAAMSDDETTDDNGLHRYENEALAVANRYDFASTVNFVTITTERQEPCASPTDESVCYVVTAQRNVPLYLTQMVGYQGDTTLGDRFGKIVRASSVARPSGTKAFCLLSLGTSGAGITFNGASGVELAGCDFGSNTTVTCNGSSTPAESAWYAGSAVNNSCAPGEDHPDQDLFEDPFGYLNNSPSPVPADTTCNGNYEHPNNANHARSLTGNIISSAWTGTTPKVVCGDAWLITSTGAAANVTLSGTATDGSEDRTLVIFNGNLHVVGSLTTSGTAGLTIIFAHGAVADPNARPGFQDNGRLDFAAPNSGTLSGAAIIVDDQYVSAAANQNLGIYGNDTFNITGLIYAKNYPVVISGTVDKAASGQNCLSIVSSSITISGTPDIFDNPTENCRQAGLNNLPTLASGSRATLVQ